MINNYHTLPGGCVVKQLRYQPQGFILKPKWIAPFGFDHLKDATLLLTPGYLVITTQPQQRQIMEAIEELQIRQDVAKQDFTEAINALVATFRA